MNDKPVNDDWRIPDELWAQIEPLLPPKRSYPKGGRPRMPDRQAMDAIFYVLRTGCQWKALPCSLGAASTVHDRFQEWRKAGVFERMWQAGLLKYDETVGIEWEWQAIDGAMTKAPLGGKRNGAQPYRPGEKWQQAEFVDRGEWHSPGHRSGRGQSARYEDGRKHLESDHDRTA